MKKGRVPDWTVWLKDARKCEEWLNDYKDRWVLRPEYSRTPKDFLEKAKHNVSFANWLMEKHKDEIPAIFGEKENFYDWAVTAFYYAIYHAALALVAKSGLSSKSHSATLCAVICNYYHKSKKLDKNDVEILGQSSIGVEDVEAFSTTKSMRERASYGMSKNFELMLAVDAKKNAETFLSKAGKLLSEMP